MTDISPAEQTFIQTHLHDDPHTFLLRQSPTTGIRPKIVAAQLVARQKARTKLPTWYSHPDLIFPPALSVEQASSERTAGYKASLLTRNAPKPALVIDLTGGMGVDSLAFSRQAGRVIYVEHQPELAELAAHNLPRLGGTNIEFPNQEQPGMDASGFLDTFDERADWLYLDPARRDRQGGKVVHLEDCEPNVLDWYPVESKTGFRDKANAILLKTSPLIDIESVLRQLPDVAAVHVVSVDNDCKEVLFVLRAGPSDDVEMVTVNLRSAGPDDYFIFRRNDERTVPVQFSDPLRYLYEPNASILKAGAFRVLAERLGIAKLAPNSHLYTSAQWLPDFPGRSFEVLGSCKPDRKDVHAFLPDGKANLTVRNFPEPAETLRKKLNLATGGDFYLFATTLFDKKKRIIITRKPVHPSLLL